jgi:hypothetical protein
MKIETFQLRGNNSVCAGAFQLLRGRAPAQLRRNTALPPSDEVKNEWSYSSATPVCIYGVDKDTFACLVILLHVACTRMIVTTVKRNPQPPVCILACLPIILARVTETYREPGVKHIFVHPNRCLTL